MQITQKIILAEPVEPLPATQAAKLAEMFAAYQRELEASVFAAFGYPRAVPATPVCGCRMVHTCNNVT